MKVEIGIKETAIVVAVFLCALAAACFLASRPAEIASSLKPAACTANPAQSEIVLPSPNRTGLALEEAIAKRRSVRDFSGESLTLGEVSQILWAGQGITDRAGGFRSAPSAGALYPIELYLVPNRVEGAGCGIYRYVPEGHRLVLVRNGTFGQELAKAAYGQSPVGDAAAVVVLTAIPARTAAKYGDAQAERFIDIEAGHISQNMLLEAVSLGLGAAPIGGFSQEEADAVLGIDGKNEKAVYLAIIGKPEK